MEPSGGGNASEGTEGISGLGDASGSGSASGSRTTHEPGKTFTENGIKYRADDNGNPHMVREDGVWKLLPNNTYTVNGYTYQTDNMGRITHVSGQLKIREGNRKSLNAKLEDMHKEDERGHIIADIFSGSNRIDNLVPQLYEKNHGEYKEFENKLLKHIYNHESVSVNIFLVYDSGSTEKRPESFVVSYKVNGKAKKKRYFEN